MKISKNSSLFCYRSDVIFLPAEFLTKRTVPQRHCDCPKFGQANDQPADEQDGATADIGE